MKSANLLKSLLLPAFIIANCSSPVYAQTATNKKPKSTTSTKTAKTNTFDVEAEAFADIQVLRFQVPGFDQLPLKQKQLAYYLSEAALAGRDIIYDQKSKHGLMLKKMLETD